LARDGRGRPSSIDPHGGGAPHRRVSQVPVLFGTAEAGPAHPARCPGFCGRVLRANLGTDPSARCARSGFRLRAPAALTPAKRLKLRLPFDSSSLPLGLAQGRLWRVGRVACLSGAATGWGFLLSEMHRSFLGNRLQRRRFHFVRMTTQTGNRSQASDSPVNCASSAPESRFALLRHG